MTAGLASLASYFDRIERGPRFHPIEALRRSDS